MTVYMPKEDSELIMEFIKDYAKGKTVLDVGCGSGILSFEAARYASFVYGCDVNAQAIELCKSRKSRNIFNMKFVVSDLFNYFTENPRKFDLIIFNPPYLPAENEEDSETAKMVCGGAQGYELIERFLCNAGNYLNENGKILLLFSSLTGREKVEELILKNGFGFNALAEKKMFFETLWVYLVEGS